MKRARSISALTPALIILAACCALLAAPSLARADMTINTSASNTAITQSGCSFTATSATSVISAAKLVTCLNSGANTKLDNTDGGSGNIVFASAVTATACTDGSLQPQNGPGNIEINAPIDLGSDSCDFDPSTAGGDISQSTSPAAPITASGFFPQLTGAGTMDLESQSNAIGGFGADLAGNATLVDGDALTVDTVTAGSGLTALESAGVLTLDGSIDSTGEVGLVSDGGTTECTGCTDADVTAPELIVEGGPASLTKANDVGALGGEITSGSLTFADQDSGGLELGNVTASANATFSNSGPVTVHGEVGVDSGTIALTASSGSISEDSGALLEAPALELSAPDGAISAAAANQVSSLQATAGSGSLTFENAILPLTLEATTASSAVTVGNASEPIQVAATVSGTSVNLSGSALGGTGGSISAPTATLTDSTAGDGWTVGAGSVTDGSNGALPFTGTSALTINGGDTFNVTASPSTTFTLNGGSPAAGTLNYNARGRTVSGTPTPTSGEIDSPTVDPVTFSGMQAVNVNDAAAPATTTPTATTTTPSAATTTPTSTTPTPNPPAAVTAATCVLRAPSAKVMVPKPTKARGKKAPATLKLTVSCTGPATATVGGTLTVTAPLAHPKKGAKTKTTSKKYAITSVRASVKTGVKATLVIDVPTGVVTALAKHSSTVSGRLTLKYTPAGGKAAVGGGLALERLT